MNFVDATTLAHKNSATTGTRRTGKIAPSSKQQAPVTNDDSTNPIFFLQENESPDKSQECMSRYGINRFCGKRFRTLVVDQGSFFCPMCRDPKRYVQKEAFLACYLCFLPLYTCGGEVYDYVKCRGCGTHFQTAVIQAQKPKALEEAMISSMARMLLLKKKPGSVFDQEDLNCVLEVYQILTNLTLEVKQHDITVERVAREMTTGGSSTYIAKYLARFTPMLTLEEQDLVIRSMILVTFLADGVHEMNSKEIATLVAAGAGFDMTMDHIKGILQTEYERTHDPVPKQEPTSATFPGMEETENASEASC